MGASGHARLIFTSLCVAGLSLFADAPLATAMEGGTRGSSRDTLALATVAVIGETRSAGHIGVDFCSGVLIRPDAVLTAAHCIGRNLQALVVIPYNGGRSIGSPIRVRAVTKSHIDPGELPSSDVAARLAAIPFDLAILQLSKPIAGRAPVRRASAAVPGSLRMAGVGLSQDGSVGRLRVASLKPILVTRTGLAVAMSIGAKVCTGDSGGPVVTRGSAGPRLWGIASAIITPGQPCSNLVVIAPAHAAHT